MRASELRKHGIRIKLQDQPLQVLAMLLERPGDLVTREELRTKLWPADTFVDFDHGLNSAINKLREALGDSADNPRFIETLPRRGYRFVGAVDPPATPPGQVGRTLPSASEPASRQQTEGRAGVSPPELSSPGLAAAQPAEPSAPGAVLPAPRRSWRTPAAILALAAVLAALFALDTGGVRTRLFGKPAAARIQSIAVLPLDNLSKDPEQEYFADGMTDELISELAKIGALRVISRTSVMQYKKVKKPLPLIARELQVDALLEGAVVRSGDRVRVTANLVQASPERHLWAESYERDLRDILTLQSDLATAIAREIRVKLTPQEQQRLASTRPVNPEAYEAYLKGRYTWHQFTVQGFQKSIEYYEQAIRKDPGYAQPYSGLADSYVQLAGRLLPPKEVMPKAKAAALRALELDNKLAEGHSSLAYVLFYYEWDWEAADKEYERALQLNPGYPLLRSVHGFYLAARGRPEEGVAEVRRASELEPAGFFSCGELRTLYYARRYDEAIEKYRRARELYPPGPSLCAWAGMPYEQKLRFEEAIALYRGTIPGLGAETLPTALLAHAYAQAGKRAEALKILDQLLALSRKRFVSPYDVSVVYLGLGEKDKAFAWLEKAVAERMGLLVYLKVDPIFDPLRSDPRFAELIRRVGIPP